MRTLVLEYGPIRITREIEDGLPIHSWYLIGTRAFRVVEVQG